MKAAAEMEAQAQAAADRMPAELCTPGGRRARPAPGAKAIILTPPGIPHQRCSTQNIQGGVGMTSTSAPKRR